MNLKEIKKEKNEFITRKKAINSDTASAYNISIGYFIKYLEDTTEETIELTETILNKKLEEFKGVLKTGALIIDNKPKTFKTSTINTHLKRCITFLRSLNYNITVSKFRVNNERPKALTYEEILLLINEAENCFKNHELAIRTKTLIRFLFNTGFRINEALTITLANLYERDNNYYVKIHEKGKATDSLLEVAISEKTYNSLMDYLSIKQYESIYLFSGLKPTAKKLTRNVISENFKTLASFVDTKYNTNLLDTVKNNSTHFLRKSKASYLLNVKKYDVVEVKEILRHTNINTTLSYLHKKEDHINNIRVNNDI